MASLLDLFKGSPYDTDVKRETETFLEEELSGTRVKSLVELNNPLIYGNESTRIALRSTPTLDTMKQATSGEMGSGGLIGGKITKIRDGFNNFVGIPQPLIPTRVVEKMTGGKSVSEILAEKNGSFVGNFLKGTGGGTPTAIGKNLLGNAITLGKDKLRDVLFGDYSEVGVVPQPNHYYTDTNTYTNFQNETTETGVIPYKEIETPEDLYEKTHRNHSKNLKRYSPIYGIDRNSRMWTTDLGLKLRDVNFKTYSPDNSYTGESGEEITKKSLELRYGISSGKSKSTDPTGEDYINSIDENDENYTEEKKREYESKDLIPFWIGKVGIGNTKKTHFRALLSGISETVSPSWDSSKFFGNPYEFKTYTGISRGVTFSLFLYCMNENELLAMWDRVTSLTKYTYPIINADTGIEPPIIDFRLGDIYNGKIGHISSLSYTYPDNGTWEIDPTKGLLPKFIEVSLTIDFIETMDTVNKLYSNPSGKSSNTTEISGDSISKTQTPVNTYKAPISLIPNQNGLPLAKTKLTGYNPPVVSTTDTPKFDNSLPKYSPFKKG